MFCLSHTISMSVYISRNHKDSKDLPSVLCKWQQQLAIMENDFEFMEPTLALRTALLQILLERSDTNKQTRVLDGFVGHLQIQAEMARNAKHYQVGDDM